MPLSGPDHAKAVRAAVLGCATLRRSARGHTEAGGSRRDHPSPSRPRPRQEQVLTTGGATRLVDRMEAAGLVTRVESPDDRRGKLVRLTPLGEETAVRAARVHLENIKRYFVEPLPAADRERFAEDLRILSRTARDVLPRLP